MKINFNHTFIVYFINNNMTWDINKEKRKIIKVINDDTFDFPKHMRVYTSIFNLRLNFLLRILKLTIKYPQIGESYLKDLLNHFTVNDLEIIDYHRWSVLHYMSFYSSDMSLNAFEIIINFGVNINIKSATGNTAIHVLLRNGYNNHKTSILNLFAKYGADLNILNADGETVLDFIAEYPMKLNKEIQNCVETIINFGGRTYSSYHYGEIYDFIKYYMTTTIKPAIKK